MSRSTNHQRAVHGPLRDPTAKAPIAAPGYTSKAKNRMAFRDDAQGILRALSLLKLPPEPSVEEIRKAYFILVKQCHPDKGPVEEKEFRKCRTQDLNNAKDLLVRLAEKRTLKSSDINSHRNKNNSGYSSNATAASRNNTSRGNSQNFNSFPSGASSNFFHKKRKDDTFFHHAQAKKKKPRFNRPTAAESKAGAAALHRSRSRRGAVQGKKRLSARDMMNQWKKNNARNAASGNSNHHGPGNNGQNSKTPAKIKEMEARNQAYLKQQEERARLVQQRLQQHEEKKKVQQKWAWNWQCQVGEVQRQLSLGEPGQINITTIIALEKTILEQPFYFNISLNPRIEQSLRWLKEKQAECKYWCVTIIHTSVSQILFTD